ncbi:transcriptional regulator, LacI family [Lachnospiraceae bacterium KM106-2]|nr:transcriptional regulator, LacI family [Lachnospiraceae bacterium KM106-2]
MNKKVTMRDIARETNVSLATVSYVLNHSEKEKISHTTRLKVLDAAKRLKYVPNLTARSLANKKSNLIGIILNMDEVSTASKKYLYFDLVSELQDCIHQMGYDTVVAVTHEAADIEVITKRSLDGAFIIDIDESLQEQLTKKYYVPIIFVGCDVEDVLFYKVLPDYEAMIQKAFEMLGTTDAYVVMEEVKNRHIREKILSNFRAEDIFINRPDNDIRSFLSKQKGRKGIVIGDMLGMSVERFMPASNFVVVTYAESKGVLLDETRRLIVKNHDMAKKAMETMEQLFHLAYEEGKDNRIIIPYEVYRGK